MATKVTPAVQPQSGILGWGETTVGRAVRRAGILATASVATVFLGSIVNDPTLSHATVNDGLPFFLYWTARTLLDLKNPKISNS